MAEQMKSKRKLVVLALLIGTVAVFSAYTIRTRSGGGEEAKKTAATAVFQQWDRTVTETGDIRVRLDLAQGRYMELSGRLDQAFTADDNAAIGQLAPQAQASLDEQVRLLSELEGKINIRLNVAANMNTAIGDLPDSGDNIQLDTVYEKARLSNVMISEALSGYRQRLEYEQQIVRLYSQVAQEQMDRTDFQAQFSFNHTRSNNLDAEVKDRFSQASGLEPDTIGASRYIT